MGIALIAFLLFRLEQKVYCRPWKIQASRHLVFETGAGSCVTDKYYRNDIFRMGGGERVTRTLTFNGVKRGYYRIDSVDLEASDMFMTVRMLDTLPADAVVLVYPKPYGKQNDSMLFGYCDVNVVSDV